MTRQHNWASAWPTLSGVASRGTASTSFLLDSESSLKAALSALTSAPAPIREPR
jgi:hypothetical protein